MCVTCKNVGNFDICKNCTYDLSNRDKEYDIFKPFVKNEYISDKES